MNFALFGEHAERVGALRWNDEPHAGQTVVDDLPDLMQQACHEVLIVPPYFVPGELMMAHFDQLRRKGIRVRVLTNSLASNDAPAAHAGYARYRKALVAMGVELYEMRADHEGAISASGSSPNRSAAGSKSGSRASLDKDELVWRAPQEAAFGDAHGELESTQLRLMVQMIAPFALDEMLWAGPLVHGSARSSICRTLRRQFWLIASPLPSCTATARRPSRALQHFASIDDLLRGAAVLDGPHDATS